MLVTGPHLNCLHRGSQRSLPNIGPSDAISSCLLIRKSSIWQSKSVGPNTAEMGDGGAAAMNIEAEGPILLSTTEVNRTFVFQQLRQTVEQLRGVGAIR